MTRTTAIRVNWIRASVECEGCGTHFEVSIDEGLTVPDGWDMIDVVDNAVCSGDTPKGGFLDSCSMTADMPLCPACTRKADAIGDDEHNPTREEVLQATAKA